MRETKHSFFGAWWRPKKTANTQLISTTLINLRISLFLLCRLCGLHRKNNECARWTGLTWIDWKTRRLSRQRRWSTQQKNLKEPARLPHSNRVHTHIYQTHVYQICARLLSLYMGLMWRCGTHRKLIRTPLPHMQIHVISELRCNIFAIPAFAKKTPCWPNHKKCLRCKLSATDVHYATQRRVVYLFFGGQRST